MKPRAPEAARLEADYLARIRAALAGRTPDEIAQVVESVQSHIEESTTQPPDPANATMEITLTQMAQVLEQLGPPDAYQDLDAPPRALPQQSGQAANPSPTATAAAPVDYIAKPFDFGTCIGDAMDLYLQNFLPMLLAAIVFEVLMVASLLILGGVLAGGLSLMMLNAIRRPDHKVDFGDMFRTFGKFWPLLGAFLLLGLLETVGLAFCIVPGLLIVTLFGLQMFFMVDKNLGVFDSLRASCAMVTAPGRFGTNFLIALTVTVLAIGASMVPYIGFVICWLVTPLTWGMCALAYLRQDRLGIPLPPTPSPAMPSPAPVVT